MTAAGNPAPPAGPAADARGLTAVDPSENVKALTAAGLERQDDLREMESRYIRELITQQGRCDERIQNLLAQHDRELRTAEAARIDQLRDAEAKRIDAIRAVDVGAVQRAAEVQAAQAEAIRLQVQAAAASASTAQNAALDPMQKRVDDLTRAQYEAQGQKTPDLTLAPILAAIERLTAAQNQTVGGRAQVAEHRLSNGAIFGAIAAAATALGLLITLVLLITNGSSP